MSKQGIFEKILYYIVGLVPLLAYYFITKDFFKVNPFKGLALIFSLYFILSYILFPRSGKIFSERNENSRFWGIAGPKTNLLIAFIFGPFILFSHRLKIKKF